jgi:predicted RNase H-like nuclease (RuvC/YqgF family)
MITMEENPNYYAKISLLEYNNLVESRNNLHKLTDETQHFIVEHKISYDVHDRRILYVKSKDEALDFLKRKIEEKDYEIEYLKKCINHLKHRTFFQILFNK